MRITYSLLWLSVLFICAPGCKKRTDNIYLNTEQANGVDGAQFTDTFSLVVSTVREDSLKTDSLTYNLVGQINDPLVGTYASRIYSQVRLPQLNKVLSGTPDSAVLFLRFPSTTGYYGDISSQMSFKVYELSDDIVAAKSYFSNTVLSFNPTPIGSFSGTYNLKDSISIRSLNKTVKIPPTLAVKLSPAFAGKLMNASSADLSSQELFMQFMKGLAIVPDAPVSGDGNIVMFDLRSAYSKISLYYSDTLQSDFVIDANAKRINSYSVSNQPAAMLQQKALNGRFHFDTTYVECFAGAKTRIRIPNLLNLVSNGPIAVNKAELVVKPLDGSYAAPYTLPTRLVLLQPDPDKGTNYAILDFFESHYGGNYNATNNSYTFNITRHIQGLINDKLYKGQDNNRGLYLIVPTDNPLVPSRALMDTRRGAGISLKLYYTKL